MFDEDLKVIKEYSFDHFSEYTGLIQLCLSDELNCSILTCQSVDSRFNRRKEYTVHCWADEEVFVHDIQPSKQTKPSSVQMMLSSTNKLFIAGYSCIPGGKGGNYNLLPVEEVFTMVSDDFGKSFDLHLEEMNEKIDHLAIEDLIEENDGEIIIIGQKTQYVSNGQGMLPSKNHGDISIVKISADGKFILQRVISQRLVYSVRNGKDKQYVPILIDNQIGLFRDLGSINNSKEGMDLPEYSGSTNKNVVLDLISFMIVGDEENNEFDPFIGLDSGPYVRQCSVNYSFKAVNGTSLFIFSSNARRFVRIKFNEKI